MSKRKRSCSGDVEQNVEKLVIPSTASECFSKILDDEEFCDAIFLVGSEQEKIKCHRIFLMARSEMLRANFTGEWEPVDAITLPQFEPNAFRSFLKFIYSDELDLDETDWMSVLEIAHYFMVKPLADTCVKIGLQDASTNINSAVDAFQIARSYDCPTLLHVTGEFMATSFIELAASENFNVIDDQTLDYLLRLEHLRVNECELFNILLRLAEARAARGDESVTIATEMQKFLPLIRFSTMTPNEFRIVVDSSALLDTETVLNLYRYFIATDPIEKQAIASAFTFSTIERRCKGLVRVYSSPSPSLPEIKRCFDKAFKMNECLSFFATTSNLSSVNVAKQMPSCGDKGVALAGVRIQCPALMVDNREMAQYLGGRIQIEEVADHYRRRSVPVNNVIVSTTCHVLAGYFVDVPINPPFNLGQQKHCRISVEVNFGPSKGRTYMLVQTPKVQIPLPTTEFCCKKLELGNLQVPRGNGSEWQLVTGMHFHAL